LAWTPSTEHVSSPTPQHRVSIAHKRASGQTAFLTASRKVVNAFLAASHAGNFDALLALLDPDVVFRHDLTAAPAGASPEVRGAVSVAREFSGRAQGARPALVNGTVGIVVARHGRLFLVLNLTITRGKIVEISVVADPGASKSSTWRSWTTKERELLAECARKNREPCGTRSVKSER
jgi:ketosteroid isomerase-like protein